MNQPQILQQTSVIYFECLALNLLPLHPSVRKYFEQRSPLLSEYHVLVFGSEETYSITIIGVGLIQQFPDFTSQSRNLTRTRHTLIIPGVFLPLSCVLLFVVAQLSPNAWTMLLAIGNVLWWSGTFLYSLYKLEKSSRERS